MSLEFISPESLEEITDLDELRELAEERGIPTTGNAVTVRSRIRKWQEEQEVRQAERDAIQLVPHARFLHSRPSAASGWCGAPAACRRGANDSSSGRAFRA